MNQAAKPLSIQTTTPPSSQPPHAFAKVEQTSEYCGKYFVPLNNNYEIYKKLSKKK